MKNKECLNQLDLEVRKISNSSDLNPASLADERVPVTHTISERSAQEVGMNFITSSHYVENTTQKPTRSASDPSLKNIVCPSPGASDGQDAQTSEEFELTEYGRWYAEKVLDL